MVLGYSSLMNILVTGGAGFIGSHLVDRLLGEGHRVRVLDNLDIYYAPSIKKGNLKEALKNKQCELLEGDIRDKETVRKAMHDVDVVFHQAAQAGVRISMKEPVKTMDVNVVGTTNVFEAARAGGIKRVYFASSSSVVGNAKKLPTTEDTPYAPISPYAVSKVACEYLARTYSQSYGMSIPSFRYFTVYGPRVRPDLAVNIFFQKAMKNEDILILGDGSKSRSFTYVDDVVDSLLLALKRDCSSNVYNIGAKETITIKELAQKIIRITGSRSKITYADSVQGDVDHTQADFSKAKKELGWSPKIGIDEGLKKYYEWVK